MRHLLTNLNETVPYQNAILILFISILVVIILFLLTGIPLIIYIVHSYKRTKVLPKGETKYKYAVLIPARNESEVVCNSINSMQCQDYDKDYYDVYVIVESEDDPTVDIVKSKGEGFYYFVRKNLEGKRTKGWALDECIKDIKKQGKKYDAYVVFDADNIAENSYLSKLNDIKNLGYDLGVGDRLPTNAEDSWVAACSSTLFAYMSKVTCRGRAKYFHKVTLMGAGFYINSNIIDDAGGWIWNSLTEDSQLTNYAYYHNLNCYYYPYAKYYDEQPTKYKILHKQHVRWVWGYITSGQKKTGNVVYNKDHMKRFNLGKFELSFTLLPFLGLTALLIVHWFASLFLMISSIIQFASTGILMRFLNVTASPIAFTSVYFVIATFLLLLPYIVAPCVIFAIDKQNISWSMKTKVKVCCTYFFFFMDFFWAFLDGLFFPKKRKTWNKIEHKGYVTDQKATQALEKTRTIELQKIMEADLKEGNLQKNELKEEQKQESKEESENLNNIN